MHDSMNKLCDIVLHDIEDITKKGDIQPSEYAMLGEAVDILKDIKTIKAMEEYGTSPEVSGYMPHYNMRMSGEGGGNYSNNSMNSYGNMYPSPSSYGNSYERGRSPYTGRYVSRDNEKMSMEEKLNHMLVNAKNDMERDTIRRMMDTLLG